MTVWEAEMRRIVYSQLINGLSTRDMRQAVEIIASFRQSIGVRAHELRTIVTFQHLPQRVLNISLADETLLQLAPFQAHPAFEALADFIHSLIQATNHKIRTVLSPDLAGHMAGLLQWDRNMATTISNKGITMLMKIRTIQAIGPLIKLDYEYDPVIADYIKATVPSYERRWDGAEKAWYISPSWLEVLVKNGVKPQYRMSDGRTVHSEASTALMAAQASEKKERRLSVTIGASKKYDEHMIGAFGTESGSPRKYGLFFPHTVLWEYFEHGKALKRIFTPQASDPFEALGLERTCTEEEVKSAYRAAVSQYHPDRGGKVEDFLAIKAAYEKVSDPKYRARLALIKQQGIMPTRVSKPKQLDPGVVYRPPQTYGIVTFHGRDTAGGVMVTSIVDWSY